MSLPVSEAHHQYTNHLNQSGKASATVVAYSKDIEQFTDFAVKQGCQDIEMVASELIDQFKDLLKKQRYSSKSISRKINSIKSFFRFLQAQGVLVSNPANIVTHPKLDILAPRVLSRMEYRALRDSCRGDARMSAIVEMLLQTGMRISELAALELTDVDFEHQLVLIRPQDSRPERKVPLNKPAKDSLVVYLQIRPRAREKTMFLTKTCRPFLVRNIRTAIDRYFRLAGISDAKVNDLRHTFIVEQLRAGTPLVYVSQLVGHKRITTTEKYLKLVDIPDMNPQVKIEAL